jgi:transposase-like protein/DNA-directed RNA polymerase subunit RPC12/RpoP
MTELTILEDFPRNEVEFENRFSNDQACYQYLFQLRWPDGFECPNCRHRAFWVSSKSIYICTRCERNFSLTAGTVMHGTKKPLRYWFKAMWWFTTRKSGVNAVNLKDLLGFGSYDTAWRWLQKLRRCTIRNGREKLSGAVEVDEFYIGGQHPGKRGRGSTGKSIVVTAVEKEGRKIGRIRMQVIPDCSSASILSFIHDNIKPDSHIITDGWKGYQPLDDEKYNHVPIVFEGLANKESALNGVHLIASLVKRLIRGTFQGSFGKGYLQYYLDEYVFRFNRRKSLSVGKRFFRIVQQAVNSEQITYSELQMAPEMAII